jgi:hypothetical protein
VISFGLNDGSVENVTRFLNSSVLAGRIAGVSVSIEAALIGGVGGGRFEILFKKKKLASLLAFFCSTFCSNLFCFAAAPFLFMNVFRKFIL